jgi:hypothetical protein
LADLLGHGEFPESFALPDAVAVISYRFILIIQIEPQQFFGAFRRFYRLRRDHRHFAEIITRSLLR